MDIFFINMQFPNLLIKMKIESTETSQENEFRLKFYQVKSR